MGLPFFVLYTVKETVMKLAKAYVWKIYYHTILLLLLLLIIIIIIIIEWLYSGRGSTQPREDN
jgi:uncharacterized SAM-binding protein YcdF (DUF218 family)